MNYTSPAFLFYAAFGALIYHFLSEKLRHLFLILLSFIWFLTWKIEWAAIYFVLLNLNFFAVKILNKHRDSQFGFGCLVSLNILVFVLLRTDLVLPKDFIHPFGLSFFFFMMLGLIIDDWRKQNAESYKWKEFLLMPVFFPLLMSGPMERGKHFFDAMKADRTKLLDNLNDGITLIAFGMLKNLFLLPKLSDVTRHFVYIPQTLTSMTILGFLETFTVYIELSSFADIGRGVAKLFGIDVFVNWRPFYFAKNPNDFWARWNLSLGIWIRDYVSFPVMLKFGRRVHQNVLLFFSFVLVGLWHAIDMVWLKFGIFNGVVVVLYNVINKKIRLNHLGRVFALLIIVGNGLILRSGEMPFGLIEFFVLDFGLPPDLIKDAPWFAAVLGLILVIETIEEIKNDHDWYLKAPLWIKCIFSTILILVFLWMLDLEIFEKIEKMNQLPIYFKI